MTAALTDVQQAQAAAPPQTVLFVCEHGAAKSVIAAAEFNRLAKERGLPWRATFRGTNPEASIAPAVAASLNRDGMTVQGHPSVVTAADVASAAQVVTFAIQLPGSPSSAKVQDWNDIPATSSDMTAAREAIRKHVIRLLDQLAAARH
jgi:protein-tyrosine-phosphatase